MIPSDFAVSSNVQVVFFSVVETQAKRSSVSFVRIVPGFAISRCELRGVDFTQCFALIQFLWPRLVFLSVFCGVSEKCNTIVPRVSFRLFIQTRRKFCPKLHGGVSQCGFDTGVFRFVTLVGVDHPLYQWVKH